MKNDTLNLLTISDIALRLERSVPAVSALITRLEIKPHARTAGSQRPLFTEAQAQEILELAKVSMRKTNQSSPSK